MSFRFVWGHVLKMPWTFHQAGHTQSISSRIKLGIYCPPFQAVPFLSLSRLHKSKPLQYLNIHR
uniref:Uncharacterized protein n=1 Tax=Populus trichocarpa TaxID=3694 RepID=A0A3N7EGY5_POPTR